jgi:hypothetical protein
MATQWIIGQDPLQLCPQDASLIQRYIMAVFYYSTRGDRWRRCSAAEDLTSEESIQEANEMCGISVPDGRGSNAWLGPFPECTWGGVGCDGDGNIIRLEMGTCIAADSCICAIDHAGAVSPFSSFHCLQNKMESLERCRLN